MREPDDPRDGGTTTTRRSRGSSRRHEQDRRDADWLVAEEDEGGGSAPDDGAARSGRRAGRPERRTASRLILAAAFALGVLSLLVMLVPYDVAVASGDPARCGPPLFELVVPPDPRFDVIESEVCPDAARRRVLLGVVGLAAAVVVAAITERRVRHRTSDAHARWLAARKRPGRRARRRDGDGDGAEGGAGGDDPGDGSGVDVAGHEGGERRSRGRAQRSGAAG